MGCRDLHGAFTGSVTEATDMTGKMPSELNCGDFTGFWALLR